MSRIAMNVVCTDQLTKRYGHTTALDALDLTIAQGEVLGYLCEKAIQDPAPFPSWPMELRRMIGETRQITFTFYYDIY